MAELTVLSNTGVPIHPRMEPPGTVVFEPGCWARVIARCWASGIWPPVLWDHTEHRLGKIDPGLGLLELAPGDPRLPAEVRALGRHVGALVGHVKFLPRKYLGAARLVDYIAGGGEELRFSPKTTCKKWFEGRAGVLHFQEIAVIHEISATWQAANPATAVLAVA